MIFSKPDSFPERHTDILKKYAKKRVYGFWKKGQATQEDYKDFMRLWRKKIRRAKAQLGLNLDTTITDNKKCFCKYISNKRGAKENHHRSLNAEGNILTNNDEKTEVLNAFDASGFSSKTSCSLCTSPLNCMPRTGSRMNPQSKGKQSAICYHLDTHTSVCGQMGSIQGYWGSWWKGSLSHFQTFTSSPG